MHDHKIDPANCLPVANRGRPRSGCQSSSGHAGRRIYGCDFCTGDPPARRGTSTPRSSSPTMELQNGEPKAFHNSSVPRVPVEGSLPSYVFQTKDDAAKDGLAFLEKSAAMFFPDDNRIHEAARLLSSSRPIFLRVARAVEVSDLDYERLIQKQLFLLNHRALALPTGLGMLTVGSLRRIPAEPLPLPDNVQQLCLKPRWTLYCTIHKFLLLIYWHYSFRANCSAYWILRDPAFLNSGGWLQPVTTLHCLPWFSDFRSMLLCISCPQSSSNVKRDDNDTSDYSRMRKTSSSLRSGQRQYFLYFEYCWMLQSLSLQQVQCNGQRFPFPRVCSKLCENAMSCPCPLWQGGIFITSCTGKHACHTMHIFGLYRGISKVYARMIRTHKSVWNALTSWQRRERGTVGIRT
jgi:hypothetical protein